MTPEEKIAQLGLALPPVTPPTASYVNYRFAGDLLYLSGQVPRHPDGTLGVGKLGRDIGVEEGYRHARLTGLNILAVMKEALGSLDRVEAVIKLLGLVNSDPDFGDQPKVVNGCSDLLIEVFGKERGAHARSGIGIAALPGNLSMEIEVIVKVKP